ncbi:hypothetical protein DFH27DRAFT_489065 [Peziza echinospora]|nr:hypothetical protein DFH27DRAFT_489065 [Peziza echinospora]
MGVSAVTTSYDPLKTSDFCRRHGHATAHIKNKVYIDGGAINVRLGDPKNYTVEHLLYLDLDNDEARIPALSGPLSKPPAVPSLYGGQLWADEVNERLFAFGGDFADDMTPDDNPAVWAYDPWNNTWASIPIEPSANVTRRSFGASTTIQDEGKAYYLGGWYGDRNIAGFQGSRQAAGDLLIFDMVQRVWRKDSGPQGAPRVEGVLVYVPAGDTGLLVSFGGLYVNGNGTTPAPMEDIDVYDASTGDWFRVKAAGTVPEPRRRFCAGESSAGDGSSHNIYLYGGAATNNSIGYGDVYILTMPSFRWIKWWPTTDESLRPHNTLSCNVVKGNQMIVMGGHFPGDDKCDSPEAFGVHNMDLSNQNTEKAVWYGYTKVNTAYKVPEAIVNVVGGSETGNATLRAPEGGFNNTLLQTLFSRTLSPIPGRAPTRTPKSKKLPKSALIGMVLGILVALILVLVGILLILKRVKNKRKVEQSARDAGTFISLLSFKIHITF